MVFFVRSVCAAWRVLLAYYRFRRVFVGLDNQGISISDAFQFTFAQLVVGRR